MSNGEIERICRLTPLQDGMFFQALRKQGSGEVIYQVCLEFTGPVRGSLLREAWRAVVRRHAILRTSFHYERLDAPVQVARGTAEPDWREIDWRHETDQESRFGGLLAADRGQPFELTAAPLMRLAWIRFDDDRSLVLWTFHHLLLDGWSVYLVLDEVSTCYRELAAGRPPVLPPVRPYWDYVGWLQGREVADADMFWQRRLAGVTRPTPLGYEEVRPDEITEDFGEAERTLPPAITTALGELARRHGVTLGTLVQAAWAVTISRYAGSDDVVFGSVVSGRPPEFAGIDSMVGLFINMLPVRARVSAATPLLDWLTEFQAGLAEARQYEHTSLSDIQRQTAIPRAMPLFESIAVFINYPVRDGWADGGDVRITGQRMLQEPHYPLHLTAVFGEQGWRSSLGYDARRFRRATADRLIDLFTSILAAMADPGAKTLGDLPEWTVTQPLALLAAASDKAVPSATCGQLFRVVAARQPDAVAVSGATEELTYRQLMDLASGGLREPRADLDLVINLTAAVLRDDDLVAGDTILSQTGLGELLWWLQRTMPLTAADGVQVHGPPDDPATVRDLLWALAAGTVVVLPGSPRRVTVLRAAPSATSDLPDSLRRLVISPAPAASAKLKALRSRPGLEVIEEFSAPEPSAAAAFHSPLWNKVRSAPAVGRRRGSDRVFPSRQDTPALVDDDPRLWPVAAVLTRHPAIRDAVVRCWPVQDGKPLVVAYVVCDDNGPAPAELAALVTARLGATLVPDRFVMVDSLPVTPDGQVDRAALPAAPLTGTTTPGEPAADQVSAVVAGIWADVLEIDTARPPGDADFFDLGGHSLIAIKLVSRLRTAFTIDFTLNDLFADSTLTGVTRAVRTVMAGGAGGQDAAISRVARGVPLPMSFGQERLWFLDQFTGGQPNNVLLSPRIRQYIDPEVLRQALGALTRRHEVLRTRLCEQDGQPVQLIADDAEPVLAFDDLSHLPLDAAADQARALLAADFATRFDLAARSPLRARLVRLSEQDHVLGLCAHHVAFDGWSTGVLFDELSQVYRALATGNGVPSLPDLPVQYADFAVWQRQRLTGDRLERLLGYWRDRLAGAPEVLTVASTSSEEDGHTAAGTGEHEAFIPAQSIAALHRLAREEGSTPFMVMLAVYAVLLARHSGRDDIVIGAPIAGRDHPDLAGMIGFFVNTMVLRVDVAGGPTFRELVRRVRTVCLGAIAHAELPFEKLVTTLRPDRAADQLPLVQVVFNYQSVPDGELDFGGRQAEHFPVTEGVVRYDLSLEVYPWPGGMNCVFHYAPDRYRPEPVARLAAEYTDLVAYFLAGPDAVVNGADVLSDAVEEDAELAAMSRQSLRALSAASRGER